MVVLIFYLYLVLNVMLVLVFGLIVMNHLSQTLLVKTLQLMLKKIYVSMLFQQKFSIQDLVLIIYVEDLKQICLSFLIFFFF